MLELKCDLNSIREKYSNKQENQDNIYNYYHEMLDTIYAYADNIGDKDFRNTIPIPSIALATEIFGEDYLDNHKSDDLYLLTGEHTVSLLNYDSISDLIDNSISYFSKEKDKDFDIC